MEKWMVKNKKADFGQIAQQFGVSEVIARMLVNRGLQDFEQMERYLQPTKEQLHPAALLKDAKKAADILCEKIRAGKKIRVIGDYDVDGIVSTWILITALRECGAQVDYAIPDRIRDGYGINLEMVKAAVAEGVDTILTCDNGIAAVEQTAYAKEHGLTMLITDHHDLQKELPTADALVNPKQEDCTYPEEGICGAVVAYKLTELLYECCGKTAANAEKLLPFAALATVCDVMELVGENRAIVSLGLRELRRTKHPGLLALLAENKLESEQLNVYHLGFILGPCLNAAGRLDSAARSVRLLDAGAEEAAQLAQELKELNDRRKDMTARELEKAIELVEHSELKHDRVLVVFLEDCHESLAGIIAGRLKEKYNRPTIVLTGANEGIKGSARSIEGYHMFESLSECAELLERFGGHPLAAGLSLKKENLEPLRRKLNEQCRLTEEDLTVKVSIDIVLSLSYLSEELIQELEILEPFGKGNEKPVFAERNLKICRMTPMGKNTRMFRFLVEDSFGTQMEAVYFGDADEMEAALVQRFGEAEIRRLYQGKGEQAQFSVIYYPSVNEYMGMKKLQIVIQRYQLPA
ncbi:MAG: single-stranded-DNA-specific exonuclease RecJ [Lachnospiraceae bacterium]|nr:single-stranded-DNA-specific exonuclease RecJ [Lachnospiraceae bacterium]